MNLIYIYINIIYNIINLYVCIYIFIKIYKNNKNKMKI